MVKKSISLNIIMFMVVGMIFQVQALAPVSSMPSIQIFSGETEVDQVGSTPRSWTVPQGDTESTVRTVQVNQLDSKVYETRVKYRKDAKVIAIIAGVFAALFWMAGAITLALGGNISGSILVVIGFILMIVTMAMLIIRRVLKKGEVRIKVVGEPVSKGSKEQWLAHKKINLGMDVVKSRTNEDIQILKENIKRFGIDPEDYRVECVNGSQEQVATNEIKKGERVIYVDISGSSSIHWMSDEMIEVILLNEYIQLLVKDSKLDSNVKEALSFVTALVLVLKKQKESHEEEQLEGLEQEMLELLGASRWIRRESEEEIPGAVPREMRKITKFQFWESLEKDFIEKAFRQARDIAGNAFLTVRKMNMELLDDMLGNVSAQESMQQVKRKVNNQLTDMDRWGDDELRKYTLWLSEKIEIDNLVGLAKKLTGTESVIEEERMDYEEHILYLERLIELENKSSQYEYDIDITLLNKKWWTKKDHWIAGILFILGVLLLVGVTINMTILSLVQEGTIPEMMHIEGEGLDIKISVFNLTLGIAVGMAIGGMIAAIVTVVWLVNLAVDNHYKKKSRVEAYINGLLAEKQEEKNRREEKESERKREEFLALDYHGGTAVNPPEYDDAIAESGGQHGQPEEYVRPVLLDTEGVNQILKRKKVVIEGRLQQLENRRNIIIGLKFAATIAILIMAVILIVFNILGWKMGIENEVLQVCIEGFGFGSIALLIVAKVGLIIYLVVTCKKISRASRLKLRVDSLEAEEGDSEMRQSYLEQIAEGEKLAEKEYDQDSVSDEAVYRYSSKVDEQVIEKNESEDEGGDSDSDIDTENEPLNTTFWWRPRMVDYRFRKETYQASLDDLTVQLWTYGDKEREISRMVLESGAFQGDLSRLAGSVSVGVYNHVESEGGRDYQASNCWDKGRGKVKLAQELVEGTLFEDMMNEQEKKVALEVVVYNEFIQLVATQGGSAYNKVALESVSMVMAIEAYAESTGMTAEEVLVILEKGALKNENRVLEGGVDVYQKEVIFWEKVRAVIESGKARGDVVREGVVQYMANLQKVPEIQEIISAAGALLSSS